MKWTLFLLLLSLPCVNCVLPTGMLSLELLPESQSHLKPIDIMKQFCSSSAAAGWGKPLPARVDSEWKTLMQLPEGNQDGCVSYKFQDNAMTLTSGQMVVIDRGNCSFIAKALNAQAAGAKGVIIRGTKKAVYEAVVSHYHTHFGIDKLKNVEKAAVVAAKSSTVIEKPVFEYDCSQGQAFVDKLATPVWETDAEHCKNGIKCLSRSCILTGHMMMKESGKKYQVCCLWDTFVLMGAANGTATKSLAIPVVYVTIANGQELQKVMDKYPKLLVARTYQRESPVIDVSSMLLWAVGVASALGAAYYSVGPLRRQDDNVAACDQQKLHPEQDAREERDQAMRDGVWELETKHAVGFIALAGVFLTVFYYVKIGGAVLVLFAVSGAVSMTRLVTMPAVEKLMPSLSVHEVILPLFGDTVRLSDLLGFLPSCALAVVWYLHRRTFWPLQDIMGICICFVFLQTVQLPNLKIATLLLTLALCYDVFFVFLSPLFFGSSVMEDVATGGPAAYTRSDYPGVDYCERYPQYPVCVDPELMPMLIVLPRILEWTGGVSMLGLGDIILPGMLLSFTRRYDCSQDSTNYFRLMAVGYAAGLALANLAVTITGMGQPALMYIVPVNLGLLFVASKRNGDFGAMWMGVKVCERKRNNEGRRYYAIGSEGVPTGIVIGEALAYDYRGEDEHALLNSSNG